MVKNLNRRGFLKKAALASAGAAIGLSFEEKFLLANMAGRSGDPLPEDTGGDMPMGKIGDLKISRLIVGGNLTSGSAHDRDLIYVSSLLRAYFTDEKVYETWQLCEENGINTAILRVDNDVFRLIGTYWREIGGKMQWLAQCRLPKKDLMGDINSAIDHGAHAVFLHGGTCDGLVSAGKVDQLGEIIEKARVNDVPVGVAGHSIEVPKACEKAGINVDFYMKTFHRFDYWSFNPDNIDFGPFHVESEKAHDNVWDTRPDETMEFMKKVKKPWIAYKVLAAGAIHPRDGFKYAFENGADFICVGMFDFQVREDVIIAKNILAGKLNRERPWRA